MDQSSLSNRLGRWSREFFGGCLKPSRRRGVSLAIPEQLEVRRVLDASTGTILDVSLLNPEDIFTSDPPPLELPTFFPPAPTDIDLTPGPELTVPTIDLTQVFGNETPGFEIEGTISLGVPPDLLPSLFPSAEDIENLNNTATVLQQISQTLGIPSGFDEAGDANNILISVGVSLPPINVGATPITPPLTITVTPNIDLSITPSGTVDPTLGGTINIKF